MDITHLEYFTEAARHATRDEAARALGIAPEELARVLGELETEWGGPLFGEGEGEGGDARADDARAEVLARSEPLMSAYRAFKQYLARREPSA